MENEITRKVLIIFEFVWLFDYLKLEVENSSDWLVTMHATNRYKKLKLQLENEVDFNDSNFRNIMDTCATKRQAMKVLTHRRISYIFFGNFLWSDCLNEKKCTPTGKKRRLFESNDLVSVKFLSLVRVWAAFHSGSSWPQPVCQKFLNSNSWHR